MMESAQEAVNAEICKQHKIAIGQCGCGGGSRTVAMVMAPTTQPADGRVIQTVPAQIATNPFDPGNAGGWVAIPPISRGGYPQRLCDAYGQPVGWNRAMREVMAQGKQEPYLDPAYDWANMDVIYSAVITATPGVAVDVDLSPEIGTFALFYYRIVALDPTTQVEQVDWRLAARPQVPGCPIPCSSGGVILSPFVRASPEACCGIPLSAFLDERTRNVPLRASFLNTQAAGNLDVQIEGRGYCCSDRIC